MTTQYDSRGDLTAAERDRRFGPRDAVDALDQVVRAATAFPGWDEYVTALDGGYVPTLFGRTRRERILRAATRATGYRVYPAESR